MLEVGKSRVGVNLFLMAFLHSLEVYLVGGMREVGHWSWINGIFPCCAEFLKVACEFMTDLRWPYEPPHRVLRSWARLIRA